MTMSGQLRRQDPTVFARRILALPVGTHASQAANVCIADGMVTGRDRVQAYNQFSHRLRRLIGLGTIPKDHIVFAGKRGPSEAWRTPVRQAVLAHVQHVGPQSVRAILYVLISLKLRMGTRTGTRPMTTVDYDRLDKLISDLRRLLPTHPDYLDPDLIIDESTSYEGYTWGSKDLGDHLDSYGQLDLDLWAHQPRRVEVWVEKATLGPLLVPLCQSDDMRVRALATHGWFHIGTAHRIAKLILERRQPLHVLWLGDFDPCGLRICDLDGSGQLRDEMHARLRALDLSDPARWFNIERIGLTRADVRRPAIAPLWVDVKDQAAAERAGKEKGDSNAPAYIAKYGRKCWEVDTLAGNPEAFRARIATAIRRSREETIWTRSLYREVKIARWMLGQVAEIRARAHRKGWA